MSPAAVCAYLTPVGKPHHVTISLLLARIDPESTRDRLQRRDVDP